MMKNAGANMKLLHADFSFPQNIIAELAGVTTTHINRIIKELNVKPISPENSKVKRFSLMDTQQILMRTLKNKQILNKVHVFYNLKGGTGKTSISSQIASHLAIMGFRVLAIDCDSQRNLTNVFGIPEADDNFFTLYDVLIKGININEAIEPIFPKLDLIRSKISLSLIEVPLSQKTRREEKLKEILDLIKEKYDYIIIDTSPAFSTLNLNALVAADQVNFVCETAPLSVQGLDVTVEEANSFFKEMNRSFRHSIIPNKYESKTALSQEMLGLLRARYKSHMMGAVVRKCEDINIASKEQKPVSVFCRRQSIAFEDIRDLVHEFINESLGIKDMEAA